jgi:hypothetical protein
MLGRTTYTRTELEHARAAIAEQVAAYDKLALAVDTSGEPRAASALKAYEPHFFNDLVLVLDRFFLHRLRAVAGGDGNPLNEVELLADSLINNHGILRGHDEVSFVPERSVLELHLGSAIRLSSEQFGRLAEAFFADLEAKFA